MKLAEPVLEKADEALRETLAKAGGKERVRAILHLDTPPSAAPAADPPAPRPETFRSREDYRRAVVQHRSKELAKDQGPTIQKLRDLSLAVRGGSLGRTVVVEGDAENLANGLALPGVCEAHLDQDIELIEPVRPGRKIAARTRKPRVRSTR
jgi:hypothetical protein